MYCLAFGYCEQIQRSPNRGHGRIVKLSDPFGTEVSVAFGEIMVIEWIDRSTEAKGDTVTEGFSETIAAGGAAEFIGS